MVGQPDGDRSCLRRGYTGGDPLRWSPIRVELCLLDWFPRMVPLTNEQIPLVPDVLRAWVRYAAGQKAVSEEGVAEMLAGIDTFAPQFHDAMTDEEAFGPAKSLVAAMEADGVDMSDNDAVQAWVGGLQRAASRRGGCSGASVAQRLTGRAAPIRNAGRAVERPPQSAEPGKSCLS